MLLTPILVVAAPLAQGSNAPLTQSLNGTWNLSQPERKIQIPAEVPGVVQTALMKAGKILDPYIGTNERDVQWVSDLPWRYSRTFTPSRDLLRKRKILLRAEGIDTFGTIWINGKEVAKPNNFFRTWEFDVKPFLRPGENTIAIDFEPLSAEIARNKGREAKFGKPEQENGKPYIRKPAFQGGWDFAPKLLTVGIWRPISLIAWDVARLENVAIAQDHSRKGRVGLDVTVKAEAQGAITARTEVYLRGSKLSETKSTLTDGEANSRIELENPELWWPNEMGPQTLYELRTTLEDAAGATIDSRTDRIGLRTVTWIPKSKENPLGLMVNGRKFFAKGSNWVPSDSLLREDPTRDRDLIRLAKAAHFNMLRVWGGGYYQPKDFYDACDEAGILTWFEFGYANSPYPSFDPEWMANARAEAEDAVRRTRNHPSIAVYSGNNEVIQRVADEPSSWQIAKVDYERLFGTMLRDVVKRLAPEAAYTPGSPEIGDDHYWDVWHGSATFRDYLKLHGFMSEYGFQAFTDPKTAAEYAPDPADRANVGTPAMLQHQKNWRDGNALIVSTMRRTFRRPKDFDSTLWLGQIHQAWGVTMGIEHWRRDWPNSTASLVWQFNDPWPVVSWSIVDYARRPKALYYRLQQAYAPVMLSGLADGDSGDVQLGIANDRARALAGSVDWRLLKLDGTVLARGSRRVSIPTGTSSLALPKLKFSDALQKVGKENVLLWARLRTPGEEDSQATLLFTDPKLVALANPDLSTSVKRVKEGFEVELSTARPALWSWLDLRAIDADYSANFVDLVPGERRRITIRPRRAMTIDEFRQALVVRSLYDTYDPAQPPNPVVMANADGGVTASADDAEIVGTNAILEVGAPSNIGNWTRTEDGLRWTLKGIKPGAYAVKALVAIPEKEQGAEFEIAIGEARVRGKVPGTKGWADYVGVELGTLTVAPSAIGANGEAVLTLRPLSRPHDHVMNLRSVTLARK